MFSDAHSSFQPFLLTAYVLNHHQTVSTHAPHTRRDMRLCDVKYILNFYSRLTHYLSKEPIVLSAPAKSFFALRIFP